MKPEATILVQKLEAAGYFATLGLLGDGNFRPYDWEKMAPPLGPELGDLWRFFLLGACLPEARLRQLIGDSGLAFLKQFRFCRAQTEGMTLGTLALMTYRGAVFLVDRRVTPRAYYGDDLKALISLLARRDQGRCLCLYSHSSLAAVPMARRTAVDFDFASGPHDREAIRANLLLNNAQGSGRFLSPGRSKEKTLYDLILAICPSTFEPPMIKVPARIAGGRDGLKRLRELLRTAKARLAENGCLLTTFLYFAEGDSAAMHQRLSKLLDPYGLSYSVLVCSKHQMQPGVPIFNMFFGLIPAKDPDAKDAVAKKMMEYIRARKFDAAYLVKARFFREKGPVRREIIDYSDLYYGSWTF